VAVIRPARADDLARLGEVERAAGSSFRDIGMGWVADDEPLTVSDPTGYQQDGRAWVAVDEQDRPAAYLLIDRVDNGAHVEQVSVHPDHARQGVGLALIDTAGMWAVRHNLAALTLTTFREVPWNAPYYARVGFRGFP
jgi:GNAT superfamily N-acetyltransferase